MFSCSNTESCGETTVINFQTFCRSDAWIQNNKNVGKFQAEEIQILNAK
jgi:hypothetical protein